MIIYDTDILNLLTIGTLPRLFIINLFFYETFYEPLYTIFFQNLRRCCKTEINNLKFQLDSISSTLACADFSIALNFSHTIPYAAFN
jgi:hypothetical protein